MEQNRVLSKEELLQTDFDLGLEIEEEDRRDNLAWVIVSGTWVIITTK